MLRVAPWLLCPWMLAPTLAFGQATAQFPVQFDFMNPGARSLATGGAFVGAADDATAAFTNPAGLAFYGHRELSLEGRYRRLETPFLAGGRISGSVTGRGLDTVPNPVYRTDLDRQFGAAFVSFMMPLGARSTIIVYRHEVATISNTFFTDGVFQRVAFLGVTDDNNREIPLGGTRDIRIRNYGGAVGFKVNEQLAVGGGVSLYTFRLASDFERFGVVSDTFSAPDRTLSSATAAQRGDDVAVSANLGALWRPRETVSVGVTYRRGPRFAFTQRDRVPIEGLDLLRSGTFKVPDVLGVGVSWKAWPKTPPPDNTASVTSNNLRVFADYDRVQYGQLKRDFVDIQALASGRASQLRIDDANELHGGAEFQWLEFRQQPLGRPVAFRLGAWLDPDHTVRYEPTPSRDETDTFLAATLPGGSTLVHYTAGAGVAWSRSLTLNVAVDLSTRTRYATASVSVVF